MSNNSRLTPKQQAFVDLINRDNNGTCAAKLAYNTSSDNTAAVIASENLRKPKIQQAIHEKVDKDTLLDSALESLAKGLNATKYQKSTDTYIDDLKTQLTASDIALRLFRNL